MPTISAQARLCQEATLREADTPTHIPGALATTPTYAISSEAFMLSLPNGLRFHYQRGEGCRFAREAHVTDAEVALFFNGSVYGAIAWINGLLPLHASSVVHNGRIYAFTGVSGAGKSTLTAALASRGFTIFSDDVLVLDPADPAAILGLPGHKQLKLWGDALALTGRSATRKVREDLDKYYADDLAFAASDPLPVARLYTLHSHGSEGPDIRRVTGISRFGHIRDAYYRPHFCAAIADNQNYFIATSRISQALDINIFQRPRDKTLFDAGVAMIAAHIRATPGDELSPRGGR